MASEVVLHPDSQQFPPGTKVKVYERPQPEAGGQLVGKPPGALLSEPEVSNAGVLTVTGLEEGKRYVGWTQTAGVDRYLRFFISTPVSGEEVAEDALLRGNNLSDVASAAVSRTSLGLGTAATQASTAFDAAGAATAAAAASIPLTQKAAASGVASLTAGGIGAQPPALHAATHAEGGSDPLTSADLPAALEYPCPAPSGNAATDTANAEACLTAAGEGAGGVALLTKPGTYKINKELIRPFKACVVIGPNTTLQAVAGFAGECVLTDSKTTQTVNRSITGGGNIDANNIANHALWCRYFNHLVLDIKPKNSLEDDCILGDLAATGSSTEPVIGPSFLIQRTAGSVPVGHYCLWAQRAGDGRMPGTVVTGQETGLRIDNGGWRGFGVHPVGATFPMQVGIDDNAANEFYGVNLDTMTAGVHGAATGEAASSVITDAAILSQHLGRPVRGANIPAESFVGTVTEGVSFILVSATGVEVKPTGAVAGIELVGVGMMRRVGTTTVTGGQAFVSPTYGVDECMYGIVFGTPSGGKGNVVNFHAQGGEAGNFRIVKALHGNTSQITWTGLQQINVIATNPAVQLPSEAIVTAAIAKEAVTEVKLGPGAVTEAALKAEAVTAAKIAKETVTATQLAAAAVTEPKLASEAVTSGKIAKEAITEAKMGPGSVTEAALKAKAVTNTKVLPATIPTPGAEKAIVIGTAGVPRSIVAAITGDAVTTKFKVKHSLATQAVLSTVLTAASKLPSEEPVTMLAKVVSISTSEVEVTFTVAPGAGVEQFVLLIAF